MGQLGGPGQALVGEHGVEAARVALTDGAYLPDGLAAVELQGGDRGFAVQAGEREGGDLGAVEPGHGDERGGDRAEPDRAADSRRQGQQHGDPVHRGGQGVEVHREPVVGGSLSGHFEPGELG